ncbi:hypothetical protein CYMTET_32336 [Cymbomonas tetramitiformis]|uniref:Uncharacterized protein n=1 Tax=Cymbomonas tetramitiformis TaxID=36881 RepID=A0AAE0FF95_9CHLO|nr:hypothetical protein CYMTET_32336 [Cymbomonas tetramitiformis]
MLVKRQNLRAAGDEAERASVSGTALWATVLVGFFRLFRKENLTTGKVRAFNAWLVRDDNLTTGKAHGGDGQSAKRCAGVPDGARKKAPWAGPHVRCGAGGEPGGAGERGTPGPSVRCGALTTEGKGHGSPKAVVDRRYIKLQGHWKPGCHGRCIKLQGHWKPGCYGRGTGSPAALREVRQVAGALEARLLREVHQVAGALEAQLYGEVHQLQGTGSPAATGVPATVPGPAVEADMAPVVEKGSEGHIFLARWRLPLGIIALGMVEKDRDGWMVCPVRWAELDQEFSPFTVDACVAESRANAYCYLSWSKAEDARVQKFDGHNAWGNLPFSIIVAIIKNFLKCKRRQQWGTAACFLVPVWPGNEGWELVRSLPEVFKVVREWAQGTHLFTDPDLRGHGRTAWGPTRWPVVVVRVGPEPVALPDWA